MFSKLFSFIETVGAADHFPTIIIPDSISANKLIAENGFESRLYNDEEYYCNHEGIKIIVIKFADITNLKTLIDICNSSIYFMTPKRSVFGTSEEIRKKVKIFCKVVDITYEDYIAHYNDL